MSEVKRIEELISALIDYRGKTPPKCEAGVPLITAKVIKGGRITTEHPEYISEETYKSWMRRGLPETGDVLVTTEAPLGEVAQIGKDARIALAQRVILLRPDPDKVDPQFFFHYMRSPQAQASLRRRSSGTTVSGIRQPELRAVKIPLLERQAQVAVGATLDALDHLIENNRRRVEILEEMARLIYREWFVRFRFPGHEDVELVDSDLGPIPDGGSVGVFGDTVSVSRDSAAPEDIPPDAPHVGLEHMPRRSTTLQEWGRGEDVGSRKSSFRPGDVLFGKIRPYFHKVIVAPVEGFSSTDAIVFRPNSGFGSFALATASSDAFVAYAVQISTGTKMPRANTDVLLEYPVTIPSAAVLKRFEEAVSPMIELCQALSSQNRVLREARDLLLPRLVSGELDVSELDLELADVG